MANERTVSIGGIPDSLAKDTATLEEPVADPSVTPEVTTVVASSGSEALRVMYQTPKPKRTGVMGDLSISPDHFRLGCQNSKPQPPARPAQSRLHDEMSRVMNGGGGGFGYSKDSKDGSET